MCGIAGLLRLDAPADSRPIGAMLAALAHRGPDDSFDVRFPEGCLGVRRLSIVDIPGGRQPLRSGPVWVALNGQIYNHRALRTELSARGVVFHTGSDVEVVAALIDEVGIDRALARMDGMFAIAAWHTGTRRLWLARDRSGKKPLYWTKRGEELRFASELKALLVFPDQPRQPDPVAIEQLLVFEYIPAPRSVYTGIQKLEAGTLLEFSAAGTRLRRWWDPAQRLAHGRGLTEDRWQMSVRSSLHVAVRSRVPEDLPAALLISGGIDSSAVAVEAARWIQGPLRTFSVVFDEPSFDESGPAAALARHIGAEHTELRFRAEELPEALDALSAGLCEPMADGSFPSTWRLSRAVHEAGFKVALSGDGADEHFGGYPTYLAHRLAERLRPPPRLSRLAARLLPEQTSNLSPGVLARRFAAGLGQPWARRNQVWLGAFLPSEREALLGRASEAMWEEVDRWALAAPDDDPVARAMFLDQRMYLGEGVLAKVDRASMLCALEVRSPFLDHRLVELAADIPPALHLRGRRTKALLRDALAQDLPPELLNRPKKGFGTPVGPWLAGPCSGLLDGLPEALDGVVRPEPVRALIREHGRRDHRRRLWTLLVLARWWHGPYGPRHRASE